MLSVAMIRVWRDADREKLKYLEKNLYTCQFAHHRSHTETDLGLSTFFRLQSSMSFAMFHLILGLEETNFKF